MFTNKNLLITGGTGSFGKKCVEVLLKSYQPKRLIIFSRDELKHANWTANAENKLSLIFVDISK